VASAKYPRLWRDMLTLSAEALDDDTARITLPGATLDRIAELSPHRRARLERYRPNEEAGPG
jgi:hypothetical protein